MTIDFTMLSYHAILPYLSIDSRFSIVKETLLRLAITIAEWQNVLPGVDVT